MSRTIKPIIAGEIYDFTDEPLPIWQNSMMYRQTARVVPDGSNFIRAKTNDGDVAIHCTDDISWHCVKAKDKYGAEHYVIQREFNYVTGRANNRDVYFLDEESAERNGFKFSFRLNTFADGSLSEFYGNEKTLRYHTHADRISNEKHRLKTFHTDSDEVLMGLEVEKVDYRKRDLGEAWKILEETSWSKEEDGSLGSEGYELVSPILPLFDMSRIKDAINPVREWINGDSNESCGGHITISKRGVSTEDLLHSMKQYAPVLYACYPKRIDNRYCRAKVWGKYVSYPEKYSAFYLKDSTSQIGGRVEIRLFSRVRNEENLLWRIEMLQLFVNDGGTLNQFAQRIGCPESVFYKHFAKQYSHEGIGKKLRLMNEYAIKYGTHRMGISPSVKKRINNTMGYAVFPEVN